MSTLIEITRVKNYYDENPGLFTWLRSGQRVRDVFREFRESNQGILEDPGSVVLIKSYLGDPVDRWFVPHLIQVVEVLPDELLPDLFQLMIELELVNYTGKIDYRTSLFNIYGYKRLEETAHTFFTRIKVVMFRRAILQIMRTIEQLYPANHKFHRGGLVTVDAIELWKWDGRGYQMAWDEDKEKVRAYSQLATEMLSQRFELLLNTFLQSEVKTGDLRFSLAQQLFADIHYYPNHLKPLASQMLEIVQDHSQLSIPDFRSPIGDD